MRARFRLAWVVVVAVGVAIRLGLLLQWPRRLNQDESLVALMGLHALRGDFPVFFHGQAYMGAPEAYASAVVYALAGPSALAAKVVPFLLSCAFIAVTGLVGHRLAGAPGGVLAALLVAVAPPFLPLYSNYAMLGYVETLVLGSLVLLLAFDIVTDERGGGRRERKLLVFGLLAGVGWWVNPLILSYLAAAGLFLLLGGRLRSRAAWWTLAPGFALGSLPFWIFNLTHGFWSFRLFRKGAEGDVGLGLRKAYRFLLEIAGVHGVLADPVPVLSPAAGVVALLLLGSALAGLRGARRDAGGGAAVSRGLWLLLVFSLLHLVAFALSRYAAVASQRYLFPLYSALPVLAALGIVGLWRRAGWGRALAVAGVAVLLLNNSLALAKTAGVFETARQQDWWTPEPIVALLDAAGIRHGYAHLWPARRLTFETGERLVFADFFAERYPPYRRAVDEAPGVAYLLFQRAGLTAAEVEPALRGAGAAYRRRDFGQLTVLYDFRPPFDGPLASVVPDGWRATAEPAGSDPDRAFDRDVDTAWLSEAPIRPAMWYRLDLGRVLPVAGVSVLPVRPRLGLPEGYRLEVSADGIGWDVVASVPRFDFTLAWQNGQPRIERTGQVVSRFAPRPVRYVRLTQTGANPRQWWAIAELFVYRPAEASAAGVADADRLLEAGRRQAAAGRWEAALDDYGRALRLDPEREETHVRIAEVYETAGLPVEGSDPKRRAAVLERLGLWAKAPREYEDLLSERAGDGQHSAPGTRLAAAYRRQGEAEKAERLERRLADDYTPPVRAEARFGAGVRLLGYALSPPEPRPGDEVELVYYWQALRPMAEDYSIFVHFVLDGTTRFQHDHEPLHGRYPTSRWRDGERLRERYRVRLPRDLPPGEYEVRLGLWDPRTGKRLRVEESALPHLGDRVRLVTVRLLPPA